MTFLLIICAIAASDDDVRLVHGRDYGVTQRSARQLSIGEATTAELINLLQTDDNELRDEATSRLKNVKGTLPLLRAFHRDHTVAGEGIWHALSGITDRPSTRPERDAVLQGIVNGHEHETVRSLAALLLLESDEERMELWASALNDRRSAVRALAAAELRTWRSSREFTRAVPCLVNALADPNIGVRRMAAESLTYFRGGEMESRHVVEALTHALGDRATRRSSAEALQNVGRECVSAVPALVTSLEDNRDSVRECIVDALGTVADDSQLARETLVGRFGDENWRVRVFAAMHLASVKEKAIPLLVDAIGDQPPMRRATAIFALGEMGSAAEDLVRHVASALHDESPDVRIEAAVALRRLGVGANVAISSLVSALDDNDIRVQAESARALGKMGPDAQEAIPKLLNSLEHRNVNVRIGAACAIRQVAGGDRQVLPQVIIALSDTNPTVRVQAASTIGTFDSKSAVPLLTNALSDTDSDVRRVAARGLRRFGPDARSALPSLADVATDPAYLTRQEAEAAILAITQSNTKTERNPGNSRATPDSGCNGPATN